MMFAAYGWRIRAKELMVKDTYGQEFMDYSARTSRLFPGLF
jgi:protein-S-isoprenylcysteine O-methyltransferase Ste14